MVTTYTVTVNGKSYDVSVEKKVSVNTSSPEKLVSASPGSGSLPFYAAKAPIKEASVGSGTQIKAPMPGKVIAVKISVGDRVEKDQEVIVVEAMKMHNPILAPGSGEIKEIYVKAGDAVQTGQVLLVIG